ncbi:MAG: transcription elongation factor GreA [Bacteroidetes bacterium]|nr:transcription elongation factor GreA [Rhodothermia bacterium]MCS7154209.1 transcription elongation factor GreA [Bacteroidota bacterium]MCX7906755.1 transcription elongation factor GreA [Bacteroidota bacterium]MDW8136965.1 transcription elongation factor GreA [Bacteroidota bacterium]MDW8285164.1 transcription elongation factor GreA [Bacteroidota bacterium]
MSKPVYLTREGYEKLKQELQELRTKGRQEIAQRIAEARSYGDLSENSEYDAAKEAQSHLEMRIAKLEETLANARIIEEADLPRDRVYILSRVRIRNRQNGQELEVTLVSPEEADFKANKLSVTSPIGKELLGKRVGEVAVVRAPAGTIEYEILHIE